MSNKIIVAIIIVLCAIVGLGIGVSEVSAQKDIAFFNNIDFHHLFPTKDSSPKEPTDSDSTSGEVEKNETIDDFSSQENEPNQIIETVPQSEEIHAIYVTGWSIGTKGVRESLINNIKENHYNAIVIDIKDESGQLTYDSKVQTAIDVEASKKMVSDISAIIQELHDNDIYVIGRIVTFKDHILASSPKTVVAFREEDGSVWKDYNQNQWPNPYNKNSWEYPIALAKEAASLGFDEIQFDYVRFPSQEGKTSTIVYGFDSDKKTKADIICDFLVDAVNQLRPYNVKVSATAMGSTTKKAGDFLNIGQDFQRMAAIVDTICPIVYPSDFADYEYQIQNPDLNPYDIVYLVLKDAKFLIGNTQKIRPYLQDFAASWLGDGNYSTNTLEYVKNEVQASFDNQIYSFALWDSSNHYHYSALAQAQK